VVSDWSEWSPCSLSCGDGFGFTMRTRTVVSGNVACPSLVDRNVCRPSCSSRVEGVVLALHPEVAQTAVLTMPLVPFFPSRNDDRVSADVVDSSSASSGNCLHSEWSDFGECSRSCGGGVAIRTRSIVVPGLVCGPLADYRPCNGGACETAPIITILN